MAQSPKKRVAVDPSKPTAIHAAEIIEEATAALRKPSDFDYFGADKTLWKTSGLTLMRHRDSTADEHAAFEAAWATLAAEYPDLVTATDDDSRWDQNPGGIYISGSGHWAVGHTDQIIVPVLKADGPISIENIHPAFVRVLQLVDALRPPTRTSGRDSGPLRLVSSSEAAT